MTGRVRSTVVAALLITVGVAGRCAGATEPPTTATAAVAVFPKGSFTLESSVACVVAFDNADALPSLRLGANYFVLDDLSLGVEVSAYGVFQPGDDTYAVGLSGVLRHHLVRWDDTTLFADVSFGPFEAAEDTPADGTRFNFVTRAGLGITHRLDAETHAMAGARYFHLSNADMEGSANNPAINGVEFYGGLIWSW